MIRTATPADLPALRELFGRANDGPYELERVAEEKCFGDGIAGPPTVRIYGDFLGASVTCGKWLRILIVDRDARGRGIGSALLGDSQATVIAAEPGNYFTPGVPENLAPFFQRRGFTEKAHTWNLHTVLAPAAQPRNCATAQPNDRILDFIEREFGRIWRFECTRAEGIVIHEDHGVITGFAAYEANNRGLGSFGPVGVAKSMRGTGIGRDLTLAALHELHTLGYSRAVIPWTDALEFYRKVCGAEVERRFLTFTR